MIGTFNMRITMFLPADKRVVKELFAAQSDQLPPEEMQWLFCKETVNTEYDAFWDKPLRSKILKFKGI